MLTLLPILNKKSPAFQQSSFGGLETLPENLKRLVPRTADNIKMPAQQQVSKVHLRTWNRELDNEIALPNGLEEAETEEEGLGSKAAFTVSISTFGLSAAFTENSASGIGLSLDLCRHNSGASQCRLSISISAALSALGIECPITIRSKL